MRMAVRQGLLVVSAMSVACSGGPNANSAETGVLLEGAGLEKLRIGEATVADAVSHLGLNSIVWMETLDNGQGEITTPQLLRLAFRSPETGEGAPVLYAVRAQLAAPVYDGETPKGLGYYTGKTSKGIGFLDSLESVSAAYGPSDAEWVQMSSSRVHYYAQQGVIITTQHPSAVHPPTYAAALAVLGKQPDDGPAAAVVTGIIVVRPFEVTKAAETVMAGQQVISTRPETTLRIWEF